MNTFHVATFMKCAPMRLQCRDHNKNNLYYCNEQRAKSILRSKIYGCYFLHLFEFGNDMSQENMAIFGYVERFNLIFSSNVRTFKYCMTNSKSLSYEAKDISQPRGDSNISRFKGFEINMFCTPYFTYDRLTVNIYVRDPDNPYYNLKRSHQVDQKAFYVQRDSFKNFVDADDPLM